MSIALSLLLFAFISTLYLTLLGYGPVKLLLPPDWRAAEGLVAPLAGYVLLLLLGYYGLRTGLDLVGVLVVALVVGALLAGLVLWRRQGERLSLNLGELGPVWLIALLAYLIAVLPLVHYGYLTPIGENWDPENYLPVAEYLTQVPVGRIEEMPPNPLRDLNAHPPRIGLTLGFSIAQGVLQSLPGWEARESFAPTLALLRGLTVLALYLLFRRGLRMERRPAIVATLFGGLLALGLWIALFNFGMQVAAMPLVPLALALFVMALRHPSWRPALLAAAAVAALPVSYYPALTVFVPVAGGLGLYELVIAKGRGRVLLAGAGTALLAVLLAGGTIVDYGAGFSFRYSQQMTTLGLFHWIAWDQILGFAPFTRSPHQFLAAGNALPVGAVGLVLLAIGAALWRSERRWLWVAALAPALLYLGWLRGWAWPVARALQQRDLIGTALAERFRPYPYAYMKGAVFVAPLVLGLAVRGGEQWRRLVEGRLVGTRARLGRIALALLLLLPAGLVLWSNGRLVARYWKGPAHFGREVLQAQEVVALLPEGAGVYLTGRPERSRPVLGLFAYLLLDHPIYGRLNTAYTGWDRRIPGEVPPYALLDADDNPYTLGFRPALRRWSGAGMALYEREPHVLSFLDLRADAYARWPAGAIHTREPLAERLLQTFGPYPAITAQRPLVLFADAGQLSLSPDLTGPAGSGAMLLSLATLDPVTLTLRWEGGEIEELALPPGVSLYRTAVRSLPTQVEVGIQEGAEAWPCWAALLDGAGAAGLQRQPQQVLLRPVVEGEGTTLAVTLRVQNDSGRPLRLALEVWENTFQGAHHYAWWGPLPLPARGTVQLRADLAQREAQAWMGEEAVPFAPHPGAAEWPEVADGDYFAALWIYYGQEVVGVLPVGRLQVTGGGGQELRPIEPSIDLLWPHSLALPAGVRFGPAIELTTYERGSGPFEPGDRVPLALEWRALEKISRDYFVTAQILGQGRLWGQWDGPIGQWLPATNWQQGQKIRDDVPLQVDSEAPPGHYRLIVAVYDPVTGDRLAVTGPEGEAVGDIFDLGEIVVR